MENFKLVARKRFLERERGSRKYKILSFVLLKIAKHLQPEMFNEKRSCTFSSYLI